MKDYLEEVYGVGNVEVEDGQEQDEGKYVVTILRKKYTVDATNGNIAKKSSIVITPSSLDLQIVDDTNREKKNVEVTLNDVTENITWSPSTSSIIKITPTPDGKSAEIEALSDGTEIITVTCGDESAECSVNVNSITSISSITLTPTTAEVREGETIEIIATVNNDATEELEWKSSDETKATIKSISIDGKTATIEGKSAVNEVTISAKGMINSMEATCTIKVKGESGYFKQVDNKAYYYENSKDTIGTEINEDNMGRYLGMKVEYKPFNKFEDRGTSDTYRLFFVDINNKYKDGEGTIYLKADSDGKGQTIRSLSGGTADNVMANFNPGGENSSTYENARYVKMLLSKVGWNRYTDTGDYETSVIAKYAVGAPSLPMYADSYNIFLEYNKPEGDTHLTLSYKAPWSYLSSSANPGKGYAVGLGNDYSQHDGKWLDAGWRYVPTEAEAKERSNLYGAGWLASQSSYFPNFPEYGVRTSSVKYGRGDTGKNTFCPIICIKPDVQLLRVD